MITIVIEVPDPRLISFINSQAARNKKTPEMQLLDYVVVGAKKAGFLPQK